MAEFLKIFIEETFHKSEAIREKPIQTLIDRIWIKEKKPKVKDSNGVVVKSEFRPIRQKITDRFAVLQKLRLEAGVVFETDPIEGEDVGEEEDIEDQFEDIDDDGLKEELALSSSTGMSRTNKRKHLINLAKKLKKKSICNRLGMTYMPGKTKLKDLRSRLSSSTTKKSWSEKFGRLLAANQLIYLPLLFRKYRSGPRMTRQELDIEIDLYMSEVKNKRKMRLAFDEITGAANSTDDTNSGIKVVDVKELFGGFGGPGWKKRVVKEEPKADKEALDMEIDAYMKNKDNQMNGNCAPGLTNGNAAHLQEELDMDLDEYMAAVKSNKTVKTEGLTNGWP